MNIKNKYCLIIELTTEQLDNLTDLMPTSDFFDYFSTDTVIGFRRDGRAGTFGYDSGDTIVTYTEMMQLLKGKSMKEFTKSDLKAGVHFVKDRDGVFYAVCRNTFCGLNEFFILSRFDDKLISMNGHSGMDIVEVYETYKDKSMSSYLKGLGLKRVWKRTEQTPAQKEMEVLQVKMNELQEQMKVVKAKL
jgi:hypothetical protein